MIIDILACVLCGCSAVFGVFAFLMGSATHMTEWYLQAIFMILLANYLNSTTKR